MDKIDSRNTIGQHCIERDRHRLGPDWIDGVIVTCRLVKDHMTAAVSSWSRREGNSSRCINGSSLMHGHPVQTVRNHCCSKKPRDVGVRLKGVYLSA